MTRAVFLSAVLVLLVSGITFAQETLDPVADGFFRRFTIPGEYGGYSPAFSAGSLGTSQTVLPIFRRPFSPFGNDNLDRQTSSTTEDTLQGYVLKFDISGLSQVASAKLLLFAPGGSANLPGLRGLVAQQAGSTDRRSGIGVWDHPFTYTKPGTVGLTGQNSNYVVSFDITSQFNQDIGVAGGGPGFSDYVITFGARGLLGSANVFTNQGIVGGPVGGGLYPIGQPGLAPVIQFTPVPEPGTLALLGLGLVGLAVGTRRRRRART